MSCFLHFLLLTLLLLILPLLAMTLLPSSLSSLHFLASFTYFLFLFQTPSLLSYVSRSCVNFSRLLFLLLSFFRLYCPRELVLPRWLEFYFLFLFSFIHFIASVSCNCAFNRNMLRGILHRIQLNSLLFLVLSISIYLSSSI